MQDIQIRELNNFNEAPFNLLLLADPSRKMVNQYLMNSRIFAAYSAKETVGVYVLTEVGSTTAEIKNIAVDENLQGKGIGKRLLRHATSTATDLNYQKLRIGTSNASISQLHLYQAEGFDIIEIKSNFFVDNYPEPIYENGLQCRHMITLVKYLT